MPLISVADARHFELPGVRFTGLASPSRGSTENSVWIVMLAPGTTATPHRLTREEVFVAIEGTALASVNGVDYELAAGSALVVPKDTDFALANPHTHPFRAVCVLPVGGQAIRDGVLFTPPWAQ